MTFSRGETSMRWRAAVITRVMTSKQAAPSSMTRSPEGAAWGRAQITIPRVTSKMDMSEKVKDLKGIPRAVTHFVKRMPAPV
jgi:hypothetical protein